VPRRMTDIQLVNRADGGRYMLMLSPAQDLNRRLKRRAHRGRNRSRQLLRDSGGASSVPPVWSEGLRMKCPACKERLGSVELQRLRVTGIMPRSLQLYVAVCPHCAASVPFAAMPVTAMMARMIARAAAERATPGPERARNVHESVSRLLAGCD
jgi:hypothetical protein